MRDDEVKLDAAIEHCYEVAMEQTNLGCEGCARDHIQLARWLEELKRLRRDNTALMGDLGLCFGKRAETLV